MLKVAVFAPIPSASDSAATMVKAGLFASPELSVLDLEAALLELLLGALAAIFLDDAAVEEVD